MTTMANMEDHPAPPGAPAERAGPAESGVEATRLSLIEAGLKLFGSKGFEASSTREIARTADANIASIGYHFGGKEGLRLACAQHVASHIWKIASAAAALARFPQDDNSPSPDQARAAVLTFAGAMVRGILGDERTLPMIDFVIREIANPSPTLDMVYRSVIDPMHRRVCGLWGLATGRDGESEAVRLAVFAAIGQIMYFRIAREIILRRMDWSGYDEAAIAAIAGEVVACVEASLDRLSPGGRTGEAS